jgi:hypothetical protein
MAVITFTVTVTAPEGVTVDLSAYRAARGEPAPCQEGTWRFAVPSLLGHDFPMFTAAGRLDHAISRLAPGDWTLLP